MFVFSWHLPPSPLSRVFSVARGATDVGGGYWLYLNEKTFGGAWDGRGVEQGRGMTVVVWFGFLFFFKFKRRSIPRNFLAPFVSTLGMLLTRREGSGGTTPEVFPKPRLKKLSRGPSTAQSRPSHGQWAVSCLQGRHDPGTQTLPRGSSETFPRWHPSQKHWGCVLGNSSQGQHVFPP